MFSSVESGIITKVARMINMLPMESQSILKLSPVWPMYELWQPLPKMTQYVDGQIIQIILI